MTPYDVAYVMAFGFVVIGGVLTLRQDWREYRRARALSVLLRRRYDRGGL